MADHAKIPRRPPNKWHEKPPDHFMVIGRFFRRYQERNKAMKGGGSSGSNLVVPTAGQSIARRKSSSRNRKMTILDVLEIGSTTMPMIDTQASQNTKPSLWDQAVSKARVYTAPELKPATIEKAGDIVGKLVVFVKVIREAQSQYGNSSLLGVIVNGRNETDTLWLNEKTVLYRQVLDELKKGPFVALIGEVASVSHPGQSYFTLIDPNNPDAVEARSESLNDIPFDK